MVTKTALEVPADPKWRHVVAATVLSAVRAARESGTQFDLGELGDLSLLLDRALDDIEGLAGVRRLLIEVEPDRGSALITVVGEGDEIEPPAWHDQSAGGSWTDPLTGSSLGWNPAAVTCSFRIS